MKKIEYILHKINHKEEPEECEYRGPQEVPRGVESPAWQEQGAPRAAELMDDQGAGEHRGNEGTRQYKENKVIFLAAVCSQHGAGECLCQPPKHTAQTNKSIKEVNTKWRKKRVCAARQSTAGSTSSS